MNIELTDEQKSIIKDAVHWFHYSSEQVFEYSGPAGSGKSLVMHAIIDALGLQEYEYTAMAYTGSATTVMKINGFITARTIHSSLYKPIETNYIDPYTGETKKKIEFVYAGLNSDIVKLICIDEGSMVPFHMGHDLFRTGIKILVCGDLNQLPPVKDTELFLKDPSRVHFLTKIMRQARYSAIVEFSQRILYDEPIEPGDYGDLIVIPRDLFEQYENQILPKYNILICGLNKTRDYYNYHIRKDILHKKTLLPELGERIICRKNNWDIELDGVNLTNGLSGTAANMPGISSYKKKGIFNLDFIPDLFPTVTFRGLECDYNYFLADSKSRNAMKEFGNPLYRPDGEKFEFGYSITTHLSQGSQYLTGIYLQEFFGGGPDIRKRLNYTGITRFRNKCIFVIPPLNFYVPILKSVVSINERSV